MQFLTIWNSHENGDLDGAGGLLCDSSFACQGGIRLDAPDHGTEMALSPRSRDLEFPPELLARLRSLGLKCEQA